LTFRTTEAVRFLLHPLPSKSTMSTGVNFRYALNGIFIY